MKRLILLTVITIVIVAMSGVFFTPDQAVAEKPTPSKSQESFLFTYSVDSTQSTLDTFTTPTNSADFLMTFTDADRYGSVTGWYVLEYIAVDTGASGVAVDTSEDSVYVEFFTSDNSGTPNKLIYSQLTSAIHVTASVVNADYKLFTLSDSTLLDQTYMRIRSTLLDSTAAKARIGAGVDYRITVKQYGK